MYTNNYLIKNWLENSKVAETCFCQDGLNRYKPRFKPVVAETCQHCKKQPTCVRRYLLQSGVS